MWQQGFLSKHIAAAGHAVCEGHSSNREATVLIHHIFLGGIHGMKDHLIFEMLAEHLQLHVEHRFESYGCKHM